MTYELVIKNGNLVTTTTSYIADVGIEGERIAAIGHNLAGRREIDASGKLIIPGAVDIHVHLQMPIGDFVSSDDFFTGTRAAAMGGTTAVVDFVEPHGAESMLEALEARRALADPQVVVDYGLHMTIGPSEMEKLGQMPEAYAAGCGSFKLYMAYGLRLTDDQLLRALEAIQAVNGLPVVHAENWDIICALIERNLVAGNTAPHWHPRSRPARFEGEAVKRVIEIAAFAGVRLHIFHVTCAEAVRQIADARARGLPVTGETCPQYLLLTQAVYDAPGVRGARPVCAPPIREQTQQNALWTALAQGDLQVVSTDHCPFTSAEKATGIEQNDFSKIPGGVPSIESRLAAVYTFGVRTGRLTLNQWVDVCCTQPAQLAGFHHKGQLAPGYDADLVIFDPNRRVELSPATLHEHVDWTPYAGITLHGWPAITLSRGEVVVENGRFLGTPGRGRFVPRHFNR